MAMAGKNGGGEKVHLQLWRGDAHGGEMVDYHVEREPGMVVLDAIHRIQAEQANDLAVRWNCKAGKCGSCSVEINGRPALSCMTRLDELVDEQPIVVKPVRTFPVQKDLVTDVSWNYEVNKTIEPFAPGELTAEEQEKGEFRMMQQDVDRIQEFRKCIECFLCQDVCHVLRDHEERFMGPRFLIRAATLEMHPKDTGDRLEYLKDAGNIGMCNITKCCTDVCPEHINITDNGIIPLKERVAGEFYYPLKLLWRKVTGKGRAKGEAPALKDFPVIGVSRTQSTMEKAQSVAGESQEVQAGDGDAGAAEAEAKTEA